MVKRLEQFELHVPKDEWAAWAVGKDVRSVAAELAARHADGPEAQAHVRRSVIAKNRAALELDTTIYRRAILIPDRSTGDGVATLDIFALQFAPAVKVSGQAFAAARSAKIHEAGGATVVDYDLRSTPVPAGHAVTEIYTVRGPDDAVREGYLQTSIFPNGALDAFSVHISTVHLGLMEELAEQLEHVAQSVKLTLRDVPA